MDTICILTVEYCEFHPRNIASNNIVYSSILIWRKVRVKQIARFKERVHTTNNASFHAKRVLRDGFYWLAYFASRSVIFSESQFEKCQYHSRMTHRPPTTLTSIVSPWPLLLNLGSLLLYLSKGIRWKWLSWPTIYSKTCPFHRSGGAPTWWCSVRLFGDPSGTWP